MSRTASSARSRGRKGSGTKKDERNEERREVMAVDGGAQILDGDGEGIVQTPDPAESGLGGEILDGYETNWVVSPPVCLT